MVRGQFTGYLAEPGVKPGSTVETFGALKLEIDSWRWRGVPFYIRAGKNLPTTCTEVLVRLRERADDVSAVRPEGESLPVSGEPGDRRRLRDEHHCAGLRNRDRSSWNWRSIARRAAEQWTRTSGC